LIRGCWGLGDNIYSRPFIRSACQYHDVWLDTPWPELYEDLPLRFVQGDRRLRTQTQNVLLQPAGRWSVPPHGINTVHVGYKGMQLANGSVITAIEQSLPCNGTKPKWDLPPLGKSPVDSGKAKLAVIRPVTVRTEWQNDARSPRPEYIASIAADLKSRGFAVVVVAHLKVGEEWLAGELPPHNAAFLNGEFDVRQLLALIRDADVVVGGVGWIVPAALALKTKAFIVLGGHGGHNAPEKITDPRMDLSRIGFAMPESFCRCTDMQHQCDKQITNLSKQWMAFVNRNGLCTTSSRRVV
jgi:hypothetical protein